MALPAPSGTETTAHAQNTQFELLGPYSVNLETVAGSGYDEGPPDYEQHGYFLEDAWVVGIVVDILGAQVPTETNQTYVGFGSSGFKCYDDLCADWFVQVHNFYESGPESLLDTVFCVGGRTGPTGNTPTVVGTCVDSDISQFFGMTSDDPNWSWQAADMGNLDPGYPFMQMPYLRCSTWLGGQPCAVQLEYYLITVPYEAEPEPDPGPPPCPNGYFPTDNLDLGWIAACIHCMPEATPGPEQTQVAFATYTPQSTPDPLVTPSVTPLATVGPTATLNAPTPIAATPVGSPTPDVQAEPDLYLKYAQFELTSDGEGTPEYVWYPHPVDALEPTPFYGVVVEAHYFPFGNNPSFQLEYYDSDISDYATLNITTRFRTFYSEDWSTYHTFIREQAGDKKKRFGVSSGFHVTSYDQSVSDPNPQHMAFRLVACAEYPCTITARVWLLYYGLPVLGADPLSSTWLEAGLGPPDVEPTESDEEYDCSVPQYEDEETGVGGDIFDPWTGVVGDCIEIVPNFSGTFLDVEFDVPGLYICPTWWEIPTLEFFSINVPMGVFLLAPLFVFVLSIFRSL